MTEDLTYSEIDEIVAYFDEQIADFTPEDVHRWVRQHINRYYEIRALGTDRSAKVSNDQHNHQIHLLVEYERNPHYVQKYHSEVREVKYHISETVEVVLRENNLLTRETLHKVRDDAIEYDIEEAVLENIVQHFAEKYINYINENKYIEVRQTKELPDWKEAL